MHAAVTQCRPAMEWGRLLATIIRSSRTATCRAGDAIEHSSVRSHDLPELVQIPLWCPPSTPGSHTLSEGILKIMCT